MYLFRTLSETAHIWLPLALKYIPEWVILCHILVGMISTKMYEYRLKNVSSFSACWIHTECPGVPLFRDLHYLYSLFPEYGLYNKLQPTKATKDWSKHSGPILRCSDWCVAILSICITSVIANISHRVHPWKGLYAYLLLFVYHHWLS